MKVDALGKTLKGMYMYEKTPENKFILFILDCVLGLLLIKTFMENLEGVLGYF